MAEINDLIEISKQLVSEKDRLCPCIKDHAIRIIEIDKKLNEIFKIINKQRGLTTIKETGGSYITDFDIPLIRRIWQKLTK